MILPHYTAVSWLHDQRHRQVHGHLHNHRVGIRDRFLHVVSSIQGLNKD